jgi:hypothetical protein
MLHEPEQSTDCVHEDYTPYSGCHEIQTIKGYLDDTSYEDFIPLKYVPRTAQEEVQTPAKGPDSPGASRGASAAICKQDIVTAAKDAPTTAAGEPPTPARGGSDKDTVAAKTHQRQNFSPS